MPAHRITYEGPASHAMRSATLLADTEGIELTSAESPEPVEGLPDRVRLALLVDDTPEAVAAGVRRIEADLPADATITVTGA